ncbi:MAG: hypothetical protein QF886_22840, partial [Planctomycetota bacterium]|nr:hypothetical protein [Planctomycetota bacterium]
IKPRTLFQCLPKLETAMVMFMGGGDFGRQFHGDLERIAAENNISGFAYDSGGGMGWRKYRGKVVDEMPIPAFDAQGTYVYDGVGIARNIRHIHTIPVHGGRFKAGCEINGYHLYYGVPFAADHAMIESKSWVMPYGDGGKNSVGFWKNLPYLTGQKSIELHFGIHADKIGSRINWWEYPPEQIDLLYRIAWEYTVLTSLWRGAKPGNAQVLWGVPKMFAIQDMLDDLIERGWYAVPAAKAPDKVLVGRYGQGLRSAVSFGNPETETISGEVQLFGKDLGGRAPIFCEYGGNAATVELLSGKALSRFDLELKPRRHLVLDQIADFRGTMNWRATGSAEINNHSITLKIRNDSPHEVKGTFYFPLFPGFHLKESRLSGLPIADSSGLGPILTAWLRSGQEMKLTYLSDVYQSPDDAFREFAFIKDDRPNAVLIVPEEPDEYMKQAGQWISGYFEFWYRFGPM